MMQKSIYLLLILLPFGYFAPLFSPFEIPKTWMVIVGSTLSLILYLYKSGKEGKKNNFSILLYALMTLWIWLMISSLINGHFIESWKGNPYRSDGLLTLSAMMILGLCLRVDGFLWWGMSFVNVAMSLVIIFLRGDTALLFGNSNFLAGYLAVTLPITRKSGIIPLLLQFIAIFMLYSWGGILVGLIFITFTTLYKYKKLMLFSLLLILGGVVWQYKVEENRSHLPTAIVAESRERVWAKALIAIASRPVTGWGWTQFSQAFKKIDYPEHYEIDAWVDRTHASLTEYGVAGGIPALLLYGYIGIFATRLLLLDESSERRMLGMVMILYLIHSQTNVTSVAEDWLFFLGVGEAIRSQLQD